jgi:hypothetical protein
MNLRLIAALKGSHFNATGQATISEIHWGITIVMTHAMFGFDGDIVPTFDNFAGR